MNLKSYSSTMDLLRVATSVSHCPTRSARTPSTEAYWFFHSSMLALRASTSFPRRTTSPLSLMSSVLAASMSDPNWVTAALYSETLWLSASTSAAAPSFSCLRRSSITSITLETWIYIIRFNQTIIFVSQRNCFSILNEKMWQKKHGIIFK